MVALVGMMACENPILPDGEASGTAAGASGTAADGRVVLVFQTVGGDRATRAVSGIAGHASKLNVQLFDEDGQKVSIPWWR